MIAAVVFNVAGRTAWVITFNDVPQVNQLAGDFSWKGSLTVKREKPVITSCP